MDTYIEKLVEEMKEEGTWEDSPEPSTPGQSVFSKNAVLNLADRQERQERQEREIKKTFSTEEIKKGLAGNAPAEKTNKHIHMSTTSFIHEAGEHLAPIIDRKTPPSFEFHRDLDRGLWCLEIKYSPRPGHKILVWLDDVVLYEYLQTMTGVSKTPEEVLLKRLIPSIKRHARALNERRS